MAVVHDPFYPKTSGKLNKKDKRVFRMRKGLQQVYTFTPSSAPASQAQKAARALHGKITAILNPIMADPEQVKIWEKRAKNSQYKTARQFLYHHIKEQLLQDPSTRKLRSAAKTAMPRGVKLSVKLFPELSAAELYEILKARFAVFVGEQGIRYLDEDDIDYTAIHIALRRQGMVIAYARLFNDSEPGVMRVGRMLTVEHGKGFGRILIQHVMAEAKQRGANILRLHAQQQAVPFYRHFRFRAIGNPFEEAEIPHILMERKLTRAAGK